MSIDQKLWPEYIKWLYDHTGCSPSSSDFNYIKYSFESFLKERESHIPATPLLMKHAYQSDSPKRYQVGLGCS